MPSFSANPPREVVFAVYPSIKLLDLAGPLQVFSDAGGGDPAYRVSVVSLPGGPVQSDTVLPVATVAASDWAGREIDTLIVPGGSGAGAAAASPVMTQMVASLSRSSRRTASVCTGAFVLAAAGLLDGRRAVTHWNSCSWLARCHPDVLVEADPVYVQDGPVWTSAGVTVGIDMALAMVAEDIGRKAAMALARAMVAYMVRPGGQSQFSAPLDNQAADAGGRFQDLHSWIAAEPGADLRVENLAAFMNMSPRSFARIYREETGRTPARMVEAIRLEDTGLPVTAVAMRCGFGDEERLRRAMQRGLGVAPSSYRRRFRAPGT